MSRYLERVENTARLVAVYGELLLDLPDEAQLDWSVPLRILSIDEDYKAADSGVDELHFLLSGKDNNGSLRSALSMARENTRTTRDIVPSEAWKAINELHMYAEEMLPALAGNPGSKIPTEIVSRCHEISGILAGTMSHGPAYQFACLGRYIERADMTSRLVDVAADILMNDREELLQHRNTIWRGVLRTVSAYQMYRQYVRRRIEGQDVVNFLFHDSDFPRSVAHSLDCLQQAVSTLPRSKKAAGQVGTLRQKLADERVELMDFESIHRFADQLQAELAQLNDLFYQTWLDPLQAK